MTVHPDIRVYQSVDSTMAEAARIAQELLGPTWLLAHEQTAARGRRGRAWTHPKGNFAATLVMPVASPSDAALRSFVAALALHETFEALGVTGLALKWPNDVLVNGAKAAGILLESLPGEKLAVGVGINLVAAPPSEAVEEGAVPPCALNTDVGPEAVLDILAPAFARWDAQLAQLGFEPIRTAWLARAARLGETIRARTAREEHHGVFETIDNSGQLVLSTARGRLTISAADVYF